MHWVISPLDNCDQAIAMLQELVRLFYQGMNQPLPYFPKTALAGVQACINKAGEWVDDEETALKKMGDAFNDGYMFPVKAQITTSKESGLTGMKSSVEK